MIFLYPRNNNCPIFQTGFPPPILPHVIFSGLRGPPSWAWQECNRILRLGHPWGAVTLSRWCVWVVIEVDGVPGGALNLNYTNLPRLWSPWESSSSRKIPTVEPGIEPGTLWFSSQRLWQLDHEAGLKPEIKGMKIKKKAKIYLRLWWLLTEEKLRIFNLLCHVQFNINSQHRNT